MSYLVVLAVMALFFCVCYVMIYGVPAELKRKAVHLTRRASPAAKKPVRNIPARPVAEAEQPPTGGVSAATQVFSPISPAKAQYDDDKTLLFDKGHLAAVRPVQRGFQPAATGRPYFEPEPEPVVVADDMSDPAVLEDYFVKHFLNQYGAVSVTVERDARVVTHRAVEKLKLPSGREACDVLSHIMVQEALQNAQRTYVMMPTDIILEMATDAFCDVARGDRAETRTILAYDALKAMPRMELNQFRALSLLLLFHYSRNTDNVDAGMFRRYAEKYVEPFLTHLPDEYSGYQQLEYLHCISLNNRDMSFGQVLRDSYPLIFAFRGCMRSELESIVPSWPEGALVPSLFNSYYKLAAVDDSLLPPFFDETGIIDERQREILMAMLHSRPVVYDRTETARILEKISPSLAKVQKLWDSSMLRRSALTLMGMYIAQLYVRECIGEEFDLSRWM